MSGSSGRTRRCRGLRRPRALCAHNSRGLLGPGPTGSRGREWGGRAPSRVALFPPHRCPLAEGWAGGGGPGSSKDKLNKDRAGPALLGDSPKEPPLKGSGQGHCRSFLKCCEKGRISPGMGIKGVWGWSWDRSSCLGDCVGYTEDGPAPHLSEKWRKTLGLPPRRDLVIADWRWVALTPWRSLDLLQPPLALGV